MSASSIKLTQYSHGAGCGCKISPAILSEILISNLPAFTDSRLLVGNDSRDDAGVVDIGDGKAIVSTTDFFMPIVDDAFDFGRIAATNAISDVYAMGAEPIMAIAILGWPVDQIPVDVAQQVVEGGRSVCHAAGISLAGGHSIDAPEPIFGLAVTGQIPVPFIKRNNSAKPGDRLYLSKPLGIGILTTAEKQNKLKSKHRGLATEIMCQRNQVGPPLAAIAGVHAMTDVTGFGLAGHLQEMCVGGGVGARIRFDDVPVLDGVQYYQQAGCVPGGTGRNFASYGDAIVTSLSDIQRDLLCDPQTSGGLLIAVAPQALSDVQQCAGKHRVQLVDIGEIRADPKGKIQVV